MVTRLHDLDPFDLPDWVGTAEVTWGARGGVRSSWLVCGDLTATPDHRLACHLAAVDLAHPEPVVRDDVRMRSHQAWQHGEVLVMADETDERPVVLAVPGSSFTADLVLDAVARLTRAVGADPHRWAVHLRLGRERA